MHPLCEPLRRALADPALAGLHGHFHTHVTVHASPETFSGLGEIPGARLTVIDLAGAQTQRDLMLTIGHVGPLPALAEGLFLALARLHERQVPVLRVKVEHGSLPTVPRFDRRRYREAHLKLRLPRQGLEARLDTLRAAAPGRGYALSRNPREQAAEHVTQFVNLRIYEGALADSDARIDALERWLAEQGMRPLEVRRETTLIDTALDLDAWWA